MAALTAQERRDTMRWLLAQDSGFGAAFTKPDIDAAIVTADTWITGNKAAASTNTGFNSTIPAPFSGTTAARKTLLFCAVALKQAGLI